MQKTGIVCLYDKYACIFLMQYKDNLFYTVVQWKRYGDFF